ncbi:hypothetical protein PISL3812_06648 [Talaromyces islandicus]|uniref:Tat pathway signal sequence n=1 Tax=Talaromyces islandicus TaxID=28573 RepID=A0A0U1M240_TALIS|nr:hypothetical protein PISL3812_06648 [Talaromyces islandicus]
MFNFVSQTPRYFPLAFSGRESSDDENWEANDEERYLSGEKHDAPKSSPILRGSTTPRFWAVISTGINLILAIALLWTLVELDRRRSPLPPWPSTLYSPAYSAVKYEMVTFNEGFDENATIYMGPPTDESDAAWEALWKPTLYAEIPNHQAVLMPGKHIPIENTNTALVGLDIFHQLHCLDNLRQRLRPERYDNRPGSGIKDVAVGMVHYDHCVESLRQTLMCNADFSPVRWNWNEEQNGWRTGTNTHICRSWDTLMEWAESHKLIHHLDGQLIQAPDT